MASDEVGLHHGVSMGVENGALLGVRPCEWSAKQGNAPMLAEAALAHVVKGVEGAYRRTDLSTSDGR